MAAARIATNIYGRRTVLLATGLMTGSLLFQTVVAQPTSARGSKLNFRESAGAEPAVLFIHGFGQSSVYWAEWLDLLGLHGIHAVALDLPGFGGSRDVPGPYTIHIFADAVAEFIHAHKLGAVTLVGNSMGSTVAQFTALRHPHVVRRLVLTAAGAYVSIPTDRRLPPERAREFWATRNIQEMVNGFFYKGQPPAGHADSFYAIGRQMNLEAAIEANQSNLEWRTLEDLHQIKVPTLIVEGRHDPTRSPEQGALMVSRLPNARLVVQEESAHTPQWDEPEAFRATLLSFILDSQSESAASSKR